MCGPRQWMAGHGWTRHERADRRRIPMDTPLWGVIFAIDTIINQFRKLKKYQGERVKVFWERMNNEKENIFGDLFTLMKLITVKIDE